MSARSQTVIPKEVREHLKIGPGDTIEFGERGGEVIVRALRTGKGTDPFATFTEWAGEADTEAYADL